MNTPSKYRRTGLICLALVLGTLALYWPALRFDFVNYDDPEHVTGNTHVQQGLTAQSLHWAFESKDIPSWHPLTWISHLLDFQLFNFNPAGHHAVNLGLHSLNALLVFLVLQCLTAAPWRSAIVAALFAWHPLHVESVAWVAQRKDLLGTLFFLLTLWAYIRYSEKPNWPRYLFTPALFAFGILASPMLAILPLALILIDFYISSRDSIVNPNQNGEQPITSAFPTRSRGRQLLEKLPFLLLIGACTIPLLLQPQTTGNDPISFASRLINLFASSLAYTVKTFLPVNLSVIYPSLTSIASWQIGVAVFLVLTISLIAFKLRNFQPCLALGWFWFLATLIPVLWLIQSDTQSMADRYSYIPLIGIFILVVWTCAALPKKFQLKWIAPLCLAACMALTHLQLKYWQNSVTLFSHTTSLYPKIAVAEHNLASGYADAGNFDAAKTHFLKALQLKPNYVEAHYNLGTLLNAHGDVDEALQHFSTAVKLRPNVAELHNNFGNALARKGNLQQAMGAFYEALRLDPNFAKAHYNLGVAFGMTDQPEEAIKHYTEAIRLSPSNSDAHKNLANLFLRQNKLSEAIALYETTLKLQPQDTKARLNLARALLPSKPQASVEQFREVLRTQPDNTAALNDLAWILATHPKPEIRKGAEAVRLAESACQLSQRKDPKHLMTLEAAYAESGRFAEAIATAKEIREFAAAAGQADQIASIDQRVTSYESGKPYRVP